jgi:hypothetical protein
MLLLQTKLRKHSRRGLPFFVSCLSVSLLTSFILYYIFIPSFIYWIVILYLALYSFSLSLYLFFGASFVLWFHLVFIYFYFFPSLISGMPKMTDYKVGRTPACVKTWCLRHEAKKGAQLKRMGLWRPLHTGLSHDADVSFCLFCFMSWCLSWRSWCAAALRRMEV